MFITRSSTSVSTVTENTTASKQWTIMSSLLMNTRNIIAPCVIIKLLGSQILKDINSQSMKVYSIHASNVILKQHSRVILLHTLNQCTEVSDINVNNVIMKQQGRVISPHTLSQYMKARYISVRFVTRNIHHRQHCTYTRNLLMKE